MGQKQLTAGNRFFLRDAPCRKPPVEQPKTRKIPAKRPVSAHVDEVIGGHYDGGFANESTDGDDGGDAPTVKDARQIKRTGEAADYAVFIR